MNLHVACTYPTLNMAGEGKTRHQKEKKNEAQYLVSQTDKLACPFREGLFRYTRHAHIDSIGEFESKLRVGGWTVSTWVRACVSRHVKDECKVQYHK